MLNQFSRTELIYGRDAMEMLKAKLYQIAKQQHMDKIDDIKGVEEVPVDKAKPEVVEAIETKIDPDRQ